MVAGMATALVGLLVTTVSFAPLIGLVEPMTAGKGMGNGVLTMWAEEMQGVDL